MSRWPPGKLSRASAPKTRVDPTVHVNMSDVPGPSRARRVPAAGAGLQRDVVARSSNVRNTCRIWWPNSAMSGCTSLQADPTPARREVLRLARSRVGPAAPRPCRTR